VRNVKLPGGTDDVGASQGYAGISVLSGRGTAVIGGKEVEIDICKVVYELDAAERTALLEGGRVVLTTLGKNIVPHKLEVQPV
jgi:hypothetical protein